MSNLELSKCCKAPASVRGGGEGTSYYVCGTCHRDCDLYQSDVNASEHSKKDQELESNQPQVSSTYKVLGETRSSNTSKSKVTAGELKSALYKCCLHTVLAELRKVQHEQSIAGAAGPSRWYVDNRISEIDKELEEM